MIRIATRKKVCKVIARELDMCRCETCKFWKDSPSWCLNNCDESLNKWQPDSNTLQNLQRTTDKICDIIVQDYPAINKRIKHA